MTYHFKNKFYNAIGYCFVLTAFLSCQKDIQNDNASPELISAAKPVITPTYYLRITFKDDFLSTDGTTPVKIKSDNGSPYTHGVGNVKAYFDSYGNLQFDTNPSARRIAPSPGRGLNFTFDDPVAGSVATTMASSTTGNYRMVSQNDGQTPAQNMLVGDTYSQRIKLGGGFSENSTTDWNFSFAYNNVPNTSFAKITRTSATTWKINGYDAKPVCRILSNGSVVGYYYTPFEFDLEKLP